MLRPVLAALLLCLAGCAQTRLPASTLDAPRAAIERAEDAGAADWAPDDLDLAQKKLRQANAAAAEGASQRARYLAEAALLHAELAETTTLTAQAREVLQEVQASIHVLREEIERTLPDDR